MRASQSADGALGFAIFGVPVLLIFAWIGGSELYRGAKQLFAFERATGTVTAYSAPDPHAAEPLRPGRLEYRYTVGGANCSGQYPPKYAIEMDRLPYPLLDRPWNLGDAVTVYYDPADPTVSTLVPRVEPFPLAAFTFLAPFVVVVASIFVRGPKSMELQDMGGRVELAGGSIFWVAYATLSVVATFSFMAVCKFMPWQADVAIGVLLPTAMVPLTVHGIVRWYDGRRRNASSAESAVTARRHPFISYLVFALFCGGITGVAVTALSILPWIHAAPALSTYRQTHGTVVKSQLVETSRSAHSGAAYLPHVVYKFSVGDREYRADRVSFATPVAAAQDYEQSMVERYPVGKQVVVYYDPSDPQKAVLDMAVFKYQAFIDFFLAPFVVIGLLLIAATIGVHRGNLWTGSPRTTLIVRWLFMTHVASMVLLGLAGAFDPERSWLVWYGVAADAVAIAAAGVKCRFSGVGSSAEGLSKE